MVLLADNVFAMKETFATKNMKFNSFIGVFQCQKKCFSK